MILQGEGVSKGIVIAKVFLLKNYDIKIEKKIIKSVDLEIQKLEKAINLSVEQIEKIKTIAFKNLKQEDIKIFDAHIQLVKDPILKQEIIDEIVKTKLNSEFVVKKIFQKYIDIFLNSDYQYIGQRASDIEDISQRIILNLLGITKQNLSDINEEVIIVANDLSASEILNFNPKFVKGFITNVGGKSSHLAILSRSLNIPAILGLKDISSKIKQGDILALDGTTGKVYINPSKQIIEQLKKEIKKENDLKMKLEKFKSKSFISKDQNVFKIYSNINSINDIDYIRDINVDGIGLFRTEFMYMDSNNWPSEDKQFKIYKTILKKMKNKKVIIRTLDIGADNKLQYFNFDKEDNPFLGCRSIRFSLDQKNLFKTQLKALIRASEFGKLSIIFPMVTTIEEFQEAKNIFDQLYQDYQKQYPNFSTKIEIGLMIETPAAAINCQIFCKYADFVSIGTNDLIQYTMAVDRTNQKLKYLYQPLNPAVLNLIKMVVDSANKENKSVSLCGEMASDLKTIPILIGLGLKQFSVSIDSILATKELISRINVIDAQDLANKCLKAQSEKEVIEIINKNQKW
ncbi:MAG: phosphoenolpyruvate--protein phosphotransferase [Mycoplasmataceae bacterium]|nr:phosphoenolpyruvate--protein phosphotransferase [Mycoplasmataceae bacterium]